eukprot:6172088-Pleurochrysis_carterae.AAC.2
MTQKYGLARASGVPGPHHQSPSRLARRRACSARRCGRRPHGQCDPDPDQNGPPRFVAFHFAWQHSAYRMVRARPRSQWFRRTKAECR